MKTRGRNTLPKEWCRWRSKRRGELIKLGMQAQVASQLALKEARVRHRAEKVLGRTAARHTELISVEDDDGSLRFFFTSGPMSAQVSPAST